MLADRYVKGVLTVIAVTADKPTPVLGVDGGQFGGR